MDAKQAANLLISTRICFDLNARGRDLFANICWDQQKISAFFLSTNRFDWNKYVMSLLFNSISFWSTERKKRTKNECEWKKKEEEKHTHAHTLYFFVYAEFHSSEHINSIQLLVIERFTCSSHLIVVGGAVVVVVVVVAFFLYCISLLIALSSFTFAYITYTMHVYRYFYQFILYAIHIQREIEKCDLYVSVAFSFFVSLFTRIFE